MEWNFFLNDRWTNFGVHHCHTGLKRETARRLLDAGYEPYAEVYSPHSDTG